MNKSATRVPFKLPCGRCIGCRLEKARQWGVRCLHEAKCWPHNSFVTLTYSDEFLPPGGSLCVRDLQLFMKRLRKARNANASNPIRFFLGAEYGEQNGRPHYHALLFNCGFPDRVRIGTAPGGQPLYSSCELSGLWSADGRSLGFCSIGEVTFESAVYCAKYALKKVTGDVAEDYYRVYDENGECFDRTPEFALMSRRPGIGRTYYERFGKEVLDNDNIIINGKKVAPPRYYDTCSEVSDPDRYAQIKAARKRSSVLNRSDNTPERLRVKERLMVEGAKQKERKL